MHEVFRAREPRANPCFKSDFLFTQKNVHADQNDFLVFCFFFDSKPYLHRESGMQYTFWLQT